MKQFYYYQILRKTIIQFLDMFNDIWVAHYDADTGAVTKRTIVPLKYGPREKAYAWLKEYSTEEKLPIMMVNLMGIDFAPERMVNKTQDIMVSVDPVTGKATTVQNPVPYNLTFNLNIWSLHMVDVDQILEQILPYFAPHTMIRVYIPEIGAHIEVKVVFNSANPDIADDLAEEDWRILKWNLTFTAQAWLFKAVETDKPTVGTGLSGGMFFREADPLTFSTMSSGATGGEVGDGYKLIKGLELQNEAGDLYDFEVDGDAWVMYRYEQWDGTTETPSITGRFNKTEGTGKYGTINRLK
jgi:hypothetical protein